MRMRWLLAMVLGATAWAQDVTPVVHVANPPNAASTLKKHYVVLVSLDGFRYDYPKKDGAPHLDEMAKVGVSTPDGMYPSYPSITFPNHYTLVTGLRPEHNGMVGMEFADAQTGETFSFAHNGPDGKWFRGVPLWVLAEQQGMRSACFFWPGSEAEIDGMRPSYYLHFDDKLDDHLRLQQIADWLKLPEAERPHLITLYYSNTDHAGHTYGPETDETRNAVHHVDELMGELREKLKATGLPVDLIVTTDHGMITLDPKPIVLDSLVDLKGVKTVGSALYLDTDEQRQKLYESLKALHDPRFDVYRRADVPKDLHYSADPNEGDPVIITKAPYLLRIHPSTSKYPLLGSHGFDPHATPEMKGIFYAAGPDIKAGVTLPSFDNVEVYSFVARLLDLKPGKTDGGLGKLKEAIK